MNRRKKLNFRPIVPLHVQKSPLLFFLLFLHSIQSWAQGPIQASDRFEKAIQAMEEKDNGKAFLLFNSLLVDHPQDFEAYWYRALLLEEFEQYETALTDFNILLERDPDRSEALLARGRVRYRLGQYEEAKEDIQAFLVSLNKETNHIPYPKSASGEGDSQISPTDISNLAQAFYHLALCSIALEENEEAISYLDSAIYYSPQDADFHVEKGNAYAQMGNIESAKEYFKKALELNPDHALASRRMDFLSKSVNDSDLEELTKAVTEFPENPDTFKQRGYFLLMNSEPEGAIEDFDQVLLIDPGDIESMYYRGKANASLQNWDKAESDYSNSLEIGGPNAEVFLARGQARYLSNKVEAALADFNMAIFHDPENPSGYYHRGITHHRMGNLTAACPDLLKGKELGMDEASIAWEKVCEKNN